jgi:hypothetical protein
VIVTIIDGNGTPQLVSWPAPGTAADASGVVAAALPLGGPFTYQALLPVVATGAPYRGGWFLRNMSTHPMSLTEDGTDPSTSLTAVTVYPGEYFPPPGSYPVTQGAVNLAGTAGDRFVCKVW